MKQSKIEPLHPHPSKAETFFLNLLSNKKKLLKQGLIVFSALFLGVGVMSYSLKKKSAALSQTPSLGRSLEESNFKKLRKLSNRYPTLQTQLDASLAQSLVNANQLGAAKTHLSRLEKRQSAGLPFIKSLNEMTLLIESHQYKKALTLGQSLLEELESTPNWEGIKLFHLIRLVELEKLAYHSKKETALQVKLREYLAHQKKDGLDDFQLGRLNLVSYSLNSPALSTLETNSK